MGLCFPAQKTFGADGGLGLRILAQKTFGADGLRAVPGPQLLSRSFDARNVQTEPEHRPMAAQKIGMVDPGPRNRWLEF